MKRREAVRGKERRTFFPETKLYKTETFLLFHIKGSIQEFLDFDCYDAVSDKQRQKQRKEKLKTKKLSPVK